MILTVACLTACQPSGTIGDDVSVTTAGKAVETNEFFESVIDHKNYELLTSQTDQPLPVLSLDPSKKSFTFSYDMLSSYLSVGTYREMDDKLKLVTDDKMGILLEDGDLLVTSREQRELPQNTEESQDVSEWYGNMPVFLSDSADVEAALDEAGLAWTITDAENRSEGESKDHFSMTSVMRMKKKLRIFIADGHWICAGLQKEKKERNKKRQVEQTYDRR